MPVQQPQFALPTIEERHAKRPPTRSEQDRRSRLSAEERGYILFRLLRSVSPARIARELGVSGSTVRETPESLLGD